MNLTRVAEVCGQEAARQGCDITGLEHLIRAYGRIVGYTAHYECVEMPRRVQDNDIMVLAGIIEPSTRCVTRTTPVTFQNGGSSCAPDMVESRLAWLVRSWNNKELTIDEFTKEFLWIHPFTDGNGRLAFLLYNYLKGTLDEPVNLPDYGW